MPRYVIASGTGTKIAQATNLAKAKAIARKASIDYLFEALVYNFDTRKLLAKFDGGKEKEIRESNPGFLDTLTDNLATFDADDAQALAREFHGRDNRGTTELVVSGKMPKDLAQLGILIELQVWSGEVPEIGSRITGKNTGFEYVPINFAPEYPDEESDEYPILGATKNKLYIVGGDQSFDIEEFFAQANLELPDGWQDSDSINLGELKSIAYFADKHHLEGPREQKKGIPYQHEFGIDESTGEVVHGFPSLVYLVEEERFQIVGGNYEILPEGISG